MARKSHHDPKAALSSPTMLTASSFTDRKDESVALADSIVAHRRAMDSDEIDGEHFNNVLTFYGVGGGGKTTLSTHLEAWIAGRLAPDHHWGVPPEGRFVTVRWDLRPEVESSDTLPFFRRLQQQLRAAKIKTPAFDLGLSALCFHQYQEQQTDGGKPENDLMLEFASAAAQDLLAVAEVTVASMVGGFGLSGISRLVSLVAEKWRDRETLKKYQDLGTYLQAIQSAESGSEYLVKASGFLSELVTQDLEQYKPQDRPMVVVFVDTFERLKERVTTRDERLVNNVIGSLPLCLFVITGRNRVSWDERNLTHLEYFGPHRWVSLAQDSDDLSDPRQHRIGNLSHDDTRILLRKSLRAIGITNPEELIETIVESTDGFPLHVDTILVLASELIQNDPDYVVTPEDLEGGFGEVVKRLLEHVSRETRLALLAAALTPSTDDQLIAATAGVSLAEAREAIADTLIDANTEPFFANHMHDRLRELVRRAGDASGWAEEDWRNAAQRALSHLEARLEDAIERDVILERIAIHALAVWICQEYKITPDWIISEFGRTPSLGRLYCELAHTEGGSDRLQKEIKFRRILTLPKDIRTGLLETLAGPGDHPSQRKVELWLAYSYRHQRRWQEAFEILYSRAQKERGPCVEATQAIVTWSLCRRFRSAESVWRELSFVPRWSLAGNYLHTGHIEHGLKLLESRIDIFGHTSSRRLRGELENAKLTFLSLSGLLKTEELESAWRTNTYLASVPGMVKVLAAESRANLSCAACFAKAFDDLQALEDRMCHEAKRSLAEVAALRFLATGDGSYLKQVPDVATLVEGTRDSIRIEFLLEHIGRPVPKFETQWLDSEEETRARWLSIYEGVVERAKSHVCRR